MWFYIFHFCRVILNTVFFFLRKQPPLPWVNSGIIPIPLGPSHCLYNKSLFYNNSYESVFGLARIHTNLHNYELNILLTYFEVLVLTISTITYGVALLSVLAALAAHDASQVGIARPWDVYDVLQSAKITMAL